MPEIRIRASVFPTEDEDRVIQSILNIFPDAETQASAGEVLAQALETDMFAEKLARQRITSAARLILLDSVHDDEITFHLGKQAAMAGMVNFSDGKSLLGDLEITIRTRDPEGLVRQLAGSEEAGE